MSPFQADIIASILEIATDGNWPRVANGMLEKGYTPTEIILAWGSLEDLAGVSGGCPCLEDF